MDFTDEDIEWFERLYDVVIAGNKRMNLTRITEPDEFFSKHIVDSALPFSIASDLVDLPDELRAADLGSGAGFPGLVLARLHPGWKMVLIERTKKKARFLEEAIAAMELDNVRVEDKDAGEADIARRDLILARAVGPLAKVTRAAAPLLKRRGLLVHYKGGALSEKEIAEGYKVAESLGLEQAEPIAYDVPPKGEGRQLVITRSTGQKRDGRYRRH